MTHPLAAALQWHIDNGVDVPVGDSPVNRLVAPAKPPEKAPQQPLPVPAPPMAAPAGGSHNALRAKAVEAAKACQTLEQLREAIRAYDGLDVKKTATNLVFADGNPKARVMVIPAAGGAPIDLASVTKAVPSRPPPRSSSLRLRKADSPKARAISTRPFGSSSGSVMP